jgi:dipeptidase E
MKLLLTSAGTTNDFSIRPHLNSPDFPLITKGGIADTAGSLGYKVYGIDDTSAVMVDGDNIEVISEGEWILVG